MIITKSIEMWLRRAPRPAAILADAHRINVPGGGRPWQEIAKTLEALEATKLVAIDGSGNVLRAKTVAEKPVDDDPDDTTKKDRTTLTHFASLLSAAYDKGSQAGTPLLNAAMAFVQEQSQNLLQANKEIDRLRNELAKARAQIAELTALPAAEEEGGIVGALLTGMAQAQAAKQLPNGKGKPIAEGKKS